jgi:hypothetical protein
VEDQVTPLAGANAVIHHDLTQTLRALEDAVRAIRALANTLERCPEALIRDKSQEKSTEAPLRFTADIEGQGCEATVIVMGQTLEALSHNSAAALLSLTQQAPKH